MPAILVLLFVIVPIVEIVVIIQVGQVIGAWWTVLLLVLDSLLGAWLLKREGARTWLAFRGALEEGRWPGDEVAQGAMVIVGGTLLLTPGFVTDVIGFVLLIPVSRRILSRTVRARVRDRVVGGPAGPGNAGAPGGGTRTTRRRTTSSGTFDVEVVEVRREAATHPPDDPSELQSGPEQGTDDEDDVVDADLADDPDDGPDDEPDDRPGGAPR